MVKKIKENSIGQAIILLLFFFVFIVLLLFSWEGISTNIDYVYQTVPKQAFADWRFYVIATVLFVCLLSCYFYLKINLTYKVKEKFIKNPVLWTVVTFLSLFALFILASLLWELYSIDPDKDSATEVVKALKRVPTDWRFYVITVAHTGLWISWRFYLHDQLGKKLKWGNRINFRHGLNRRDWGAYSNLRERALALRTRAGLTLIGVFGLLFGGIYFVIFLIPQTEADKGDIIRKSLQQESFKRKFGSKLQAMVEGRYWFKTHDGVSNRRLPRELPRRPTFFGSQFRGPLVLFSGSATYRELQIQSMKSNGKTGLIVNHDRSVNITKDAGQTWETRAFSSKQNKMPPLKWGERIVAARLSDDGKRGLLASQNGTVFLISVKNGKLTLQSTDLSLKTNVNLPLKQGERIVAAGFNDDGKRGLLASQNGTVFLISVKNSKLTLQSTDLSLKTNVNPPLKQGERIVAAGFNDDGKRGLLASQNGTVFLISVKNSKLTLQSTDLSLKTNVNPPLKLGERIWRITLNNDGKRGLLVGNRGSVFMMTTNGNNWIPLNLELKNREQIIHTTFSDDGKRALLAGYRGSVFMTADSGRNWTRGNAKLRPENRVIAVIFSNDVLHGLIADNQGSVFVSKNNGQTWHETKWDGRVPSLAYLVSVPLGEKAHAAVAVDRNGNAYHLKEHPDIAGWEKGELADLVKNKFLRDSEIFKEISAHLATGGSFGSNKGSENKTDDTFSIFGTTLNQATLMQFAFMTVLFFLVQLLVSLCKYSMRLANFWDSRADAILLRQNFADKKAKKFDDLVQALAPDAYDFKPMPRSLFGWSLPRRD